MKLQQLPKEEGHNLGTPDEVKSQERPTPKISPSALRAKNILAAIQDSFVPRFPHLKRAEIRNS